MAMEAEYTITRPIESSSAADQASDASYTRRLRGSRARAEKLDSASHLLRGIASLGMRRLSHVCAHRRLEALAPLLEAAEHVEAGAGGRQQDRVARLCERDGTLDRCVE